MVSFKPILRFNHILCLEINILTSMEWILAFIVGGVYILVLMLNTTRLRRENGSS
ncbi:MAG: hypothetical protein Q7U35_10285 [Methanobacteriaceae archaeon]|nr:hypothetical protein [Methanobacteriaceae archaeon]